MVARTLVYYFHSPSLWLNACCITSTVDTCATATSLDNPITQQQKCNNIFILILKLKVESQAFLSTTPVKKTKHHTFTYIISSLHTQFFFSWKFFTATIILSFVRETVITSEKFRKHSLIRLPAQF